MVQSIRELKDKWSSDGKRVILLARKVVGTDSVLSSGMSAVETEEQVSREVQGDLTLIGLLALIDPPRPEIPEVMRIMRGAGIRTFMVRYSGISRRKEYLANVAIRSLATSASRLCPSPANATW